MRGSRILFLYALAATAASPAMAEVVETRPNGFTVQYDATVAEAPGVLFDRFGHPELWWSAEHTWFGSAANLSMDMRAGGCWCEKTPDGTDEVEHMRVFFVAKDKVIRLKGLLGPLANNAGNGVMSISFVEKDGQTQVRLIYDVEGHLTPAAEQLAPLVDGVLGAQFSRFLNRNQ